MHLLQGCDPNFILALINGRPLPTDMSEHKLFVDSLPPAENGLRAWAMQEKFFRQSLDGTPQDASADGKYLKDRWRSIVDRYQASGEPKANEDPEDPEDHAIRQIADEQMARRMVRCLWDHAARQGVIRAKRNAWPEVARLLRRHLDGWIQSGYSSITGESPLSRTLPKILQNDLKKFCIANPPLVNILEWGDLVGSWPSGPAALADFAAFEGFRLMLTVLSSDFKFRIAKCLKCGRYFARTKLQECFKRGSYCAKHSKGAGTDAQRKLEHYALVSSAATFSERWTPRKHPNQAFWIVQKVNESRKGTERRITKNWLSNKRNSMAIQEEVERRNRARR
jgi:hypothetical protein